MLCRRAHDFEPFTVSTFFVICARQSAVPESSSCVSCEGNSCNGLEFVVVRWAPMACGKELLRLLAPPSGTAAHWLHPMVAADLLVLAERGAVL
jgi:hypothetical protein